MVERSFAVTIGGAASAALLLFLSVGSIGLIWLWADTSGGLGQSEFSAISFTLQQAFVSACLSCLIAIPLARALARQQFFGRRLLIGLLGAPFILPVIVAVFGLLAIFGRAGFLNMALAALGFETVSIYGFYGVVLAHVFFNIPLAARLILHGWMEIPAERFRLAESLRFSAWAYFRQIEWPMLKTVLPGIFTTIFLICITSFAVALTMGGGPKATTVELAIYQAFRYDFDLGRAAKLAFIQFVICIIAAGISTLFTLPNALNIGHDRVVKRWDGQKHVDYAVILILSLFLLAPIGSIIVDGSINLFRLSDVVWIAATRSLLIAFASVAVVMALTLSLGLWIIQLKRGGRIVEVIGYLSITASSLVIGTALFIMVFPFANPQDLALPITVLVNAVMALPFALRSILPALRECEASYGRLAASLRLTGWVRFKRLTLPRIQRPLRFAAGLTAALSIGDLGVIALFAAPDGGTLPLMIYRLMGSYQMEQASGAVLLLLIMSFAIFWMIDGGGRKGA